VGEHQDGVSVVMMLVVHDVVVVDVADVVGVAAAVEAAMRGVVTSSLVRG